VLIKWSPEGGEAKEYTFKPGKLTSAEAEAIESVTDWTYADFGERLLNGSKLALRVALWIVRKREEPDLRFSKVGFLMDEVTLGMDDEERQDIRDWLTKNPDADEDERAAAAALLAVSPEEILASTEESGKDQAAEEAPASDA
jgi:hypothetical protein